MSQVKQVFLVGHCGPDTFSLTSWVGRVLDQASISQVNDGAELAEAGEDTLLLVNRVLDGAFEDEDGIELIRRLSSQATHPRMILISNFADAQQQAEQAGALPGFGKSELGSPQATHRLQEAAAVNNETSEAS